MQITKAALTIKESRTFTAFTPFKDLYSLAFELRVEMRNYEHSLSSGNGDLIIFAEASGMIEPREGAFHHPSPREFFPLMGFDFL